MPQKSPIALTSDDFKSPFSLSQWIERIFWQDSENDAFRDILEPAVENEAGCSWSNDAQEKLTPKQRCHIWQLALRELNHLLE